jgi:phage tail sheath protein FI
MPDYLYPGVYVQEMDPGMHPIDGVSTTNVAFVGFAQDGPFTPTLITNFLEFSASFGGFAPGKNLAYAVQGFFLNGGVHCYILRLPPEIQSGTIEPGEIPLGPLDALADVSIVCCPDEHSISGMTAALVDHCEQRKDRVAILAAPLDADMQSGPPAEAQSSFVAYYMPWVLVEDAAGGAALVVHPGGHVAGAVVQADLEHGVWKAPANLPILGIVGLERQIDDQQQGPLIARGVNVLRSFPGRGNLIWGARTTSQDTEWKYINLRRYFIYLEQSIDQGLQWVVFEPNGEALWSQVQQSVANFLFNEHRSGALQGSSPTQAYFVRCDTSTMTQDDIDNGRLICLVGVAPVHPAEFIIFQIGKLTGPGASPCT